MGWKDLVVLVVGCLLNIRTSVDRVRARFFAMVVFLLGTKQAGRVGPLISLPYACLLCLCGIPYGPNTKQFLLGTLAPHLHALVKVWQ